MSVLSSGLTQKRMHLSPMCWKVCTPANRCPYSIHTYINPHSLRFKAAFSASDRSEISYADTVGSIRLFFVCPKRFYFHSEQIPASSICILSTDSQLLIYPHVEKVRIFRKAVHTQPANFLFLKSIFYLSFTNSVLQIWILIFRNNLLLTGNKNEVRKPFFGDNSSGFWTSWFPILYILLIMGYCQLRKIL